VIGELRCHPSIVVENTLQVALIVIIWLLFAGQLGATVLVGMAAAVLIATLALNYWRWKRTLVRFGEAEVVVERRTLFKLKKTLPYSKIASVNVNRGIVNRLFGTSRLMLNINSGHNAVVPEASLVFKKELADRIRAEIAPRLYARDLTAEEEATPLASFSLQDVIVHSLFSVPTHQTLLGAAFLVYSIFELYQSTVQELATGGTAFLSLGMFFLLQVLPSIGHMVRYYGFKVHRSGDTIYLQHGLIRSYKTSFPVSKINAVRIKSTFASRRLGRSCIEAEVVGIASGDGQSSARPVVCLLRDDDETRRLLRELVPEFIYQGRPSRQPKGAGRVLLIEAAVASLAVVAVAAVLTLLAYDAFAARTDAMSTMPYALPALAALVVLGIAYAARTSYRVREFDAGEDLFTFVNGVLDRETVVMSYDKVQIVHVIKGPLARRFGVSRARVFLLSSVGTRTISSGLFPESQLDEVGEVVLERIATGKYDHRVSGV
jgi:putative membrane protein